MGSTSSKSNSRMMRIFIGYDGSSCADSALDDLQRAGLPREADAFVLTVSEVWLPPPPRVERVQSHSGAAAAAVLERAPSVSFLPDEVLEASRELALKGAARLRSYFADWRVQAEAVAGSPAREVLKKANEWDSDLIVVGCQGCSGLGRFLLGSVSQKVVSEAPCSVRVARGTVWKQGSPVRMVIGLDGSLASQAAVTTVASRTWPMGSEVRIVAVEDKLGLLGRIAPHAAQRIENHHIEARAWLEGLAKAAAARLRTADLTVSSKIEIGDPKRILVSDAEEWGAECIFLGSSGSRNHVNSLLLGSVATAVVARAHCSVEILRARQSIERG